MERTGLKGLYYKIKRRTMRLSQTEVANDVGVSRYTLAKYETGEAQIPITVDIKLKSYFEKTEKHSY